MKKARPRRPSAALVISCIALFVALGGASYAAINLPKNSVGTKQIKKKAVKTNKLATKAVKVGKIGPEAVKAGKIAKNAITTNRLRKAAVTGAKINAPTTPFGQIVSQLVGTASVPFESGKNYPLDTPTYTQPASRGADQYPLRRWSVKFSAGCEAPRSAAAYCGARCRQPRQTHGTVWLRYWHPRSVTDEGSGDVTRTAYCSRRLQAVRPFWRACSLPPIPPHTFSGSSMSSLELQKRLGHYRDRSHDRPDRHQVATFRDARGRLWAPSRSPRTPSRSASGQPPTALATSVQPSAALQSTTNGGSRCARRPYCGPPNVDTQAVRALTYSSPATGAPP